MILKHEFHRSASWQAKLLLVVFSLGVLPLAATAMSPDEEPRQTPAESAVDNQRPGLPKDAAVHFVELSQDKAQRAVKREEFEEAAALLNGTWAVERTIDNGIEHAITDNFEYYHWRFDATTRAVTTKWKKKAAGGNKGLANRFIANPTTHPKQLTIYGEDILLQAIYELDGDTMKVAMHGRAEIARPPSFDASQRSSTAGPIMVFILRRIKTPVARFDTSPSPEPRAGKTEVSRERARWGGFWKVVRTERHGKVIRPGLSGQISTPIEMAVRGEKISVGWSNGGETIGEVILDSTRSPGEFEFGWLIPLRGIYRFDAERLTICYNPSDSPKAGIRPSDFQTKRDADRVLCVFERQHRRKKP